MESNNLKNLILEFVKVTEEAAIASYNFIGKGNEKEADAAAVNSMRQALNVLPIQGSIVIGEGERDKAPMLYIGEKLGKGGLCEVDIAVDPLEGTTLCANAADGAMSVMAVAPKGNLLNAPDIYMEKIAIGSGYAEGIIDLDNNIKTNLSNLAKAKKCNISDLSVTILKRDRHNELISKAREAGAKVKLITDGDIAAVISTVLNKHTDMYIGIGGAPEGILAAAALRTLEGQMMGRLIFSNDDERQRASKMGIIDFNHKYTTKELAKDEVIFVATGVTSGQIIQGVDKSNNIIKTYSVITESSTKSVKYINSHYKI
ncbi:MAG: class II fructose-bisphosphatase [Alphaproteobacteria bacterium]